MANRAESLDLTVAVRETLAAIPNDPRDATLRTLIRRYCDEIESTGTTERLGSRLLSALKALQATQYMRKAGVVYLRGLAKSGTIGTSIGTLPSGYRPAQSFMVPAMSNSALGRLDVNSSGTIIPQTGSNLYVSLGGISFPAEQ